MPGDGTSPKARQDPPSTDANPARPDAGAATVGAESGASGTPPSSVRPVGRPVLRFVLRLGLLMAIYYGVTITPAFKEWFFPPIHRTNTRAVVSVLRWFGHDVTADDRQILTPEGGRLEVRRGCDAIEPTALFVAAVLAFPLSFRVKWPAVLAGIAGLLTINLIRIVTLYWTHVYIPKAFDIVHTQVWQALFIFLAIGFWVMWVWWATRTKAAVADVSV